MVCAEPTLQHIPTLHNSLICSFQTLSILLIPSNPLRLSICIALIPDLSFSYHNIVSLPYIRTRTSNVSCKTLVHSSCKSRALTRDLMAPATLLSLATFLLHSAPSVPDSSKTPQIFKFRDMLQTNLVYMNLSIQSLFSIQYHHLPLAYIHFLSSSLTHLITIIIIFIIIIQGSYKNSSPHYPCGL